MTRTSSCPALRRLSRAAALLALLALLLASSCSRNGGKVPTAVDVPGIVAEAKGEKPVRFWNDSPARQAVRGSLKRLMQSDAEFEAEIGKRFRRHELASYFLTPNSFIGGTWPRGTAQLLREVEHLERDYLVELDSFSAVLERALSQAGVPEDRLRPLVDDLAAGVAAARAPLIEATQAHLRFVDAAADLYEIAASSPDSFKDMRTGLEISDDSLLYQFNSQVDVVNAAADAAEAAVRRLDQQHQGARRDLGITKRAR